MSQERKDDRPAASSEQDKHHEPGTPVAPSGFQGLLSLATPLTRFVLYPMDQLKLVGSNLRQMVSKKFDPEKDIIDQDGKVILITGGNAGLGKETVLQLAKHNPLRIYLAARNSSKAQAAIDDIQKQLPQHADIRHLPLDLSSFTSIRAAAREFTSSNERLDTLILNAGVMDPLPNRTEDGFEVDFGTNHLGHFLFTKLLLPTLTKTAQETKSAGKPADVRIIVVASMAWQMSPPLSTMLSTDSLLALNPPTRYGASKAANIAFASELARRYPELSCVSLHPGVIITGLYDSLMATNPVARVGLRIAKSITVDEKQGSLNHLWTAGSERGALRSGEYYTPVGVGGWKNKWAEDRELGRTLWEWSEEAIRDQKK
ncbi:short chain dehydrogenase/reductase [Coccidioides immitis RS]|uniref:Short chain dehydrogenase/reductase n=3 Tax=Coccidioides immitis TaxID=5501 RepID=J3K0P4_COCIM|nr:short chain dehydrogenase/reductase [Coccidioides immitis RS]EAS27434.3 short chain dehydrogenase/reductase [Coccidioides immitis RS]KMU75321.1 retinol dehydrogenase 12 [Coccidioides immitis RMSCC 3703]KMU88474.1 retinol dehydrogenase 12 [Coccidioides immitis H538.4]TPX20225.1 hypothetical protein DIZ76_016113 [Coccidioides immitis]